MGNATFSDEQIQLLENNPYTQKVTHKILSFTKEFGGLFYSQYQKGIPARDILEQCGYPPEVLGKHRIWGIAYHINKEYRTYSLFLSETYSQDPDGSSTAALESAVKHLSHEVEYLKHEVDF